MYLVAQLWWLLLMAFIFGAFIGYVVWKACGRPRVEEQYRRESKELTGRIVALEQERDRISAAALEAEREIARLKPGAGKITPVPRADKT